jgi:hypothetical protein
VNERIDCGVRICIQWRNFWRERSLARFERKAISNSKFQMAERATARAVWLVEGLQQRLSCSWDILEFLGATKSG